MINRINRFLNKLYQMGAIKRTIVVWVSFQAILWLFFGLGYLAYPDAWVNVSATEPASAAVGGLMSTTMFIIGSNAVLLGLIAVGNLFVRFGPITPGILILLTQGVSIGWLAGTNGFAVPFTSVLAANVQYLRVGLWETTAYAVACSITLPKSLFVATSFPAREWAEERKISDISFSSTERALGMLAGIALVLAAFIEALHLTS